MKNALDCDPLDSYPNAVPDPHDPRQFWDLDEGGWWRWCYTDGWHPVAEQDLPNTHEYVVLWVSLRLRGL